MGAYDTPSSECPYCKENCEADFVDVGVGMVQYGPYHCYSCGASEIGPELFDWCYKDRKDNMIYLTGKRRYYSWSKNGKGGKIRDSGDIVLKFNAPFSEKELETGFYDPFKKKISPYANTINGVLVDYKTAKDAYRIGLLDEKEIK